MYKLITKITTVAVNAGVVVFLGALTGSVIKSIKQADEEYKIEMEMKRVELEKAKAELSK